MQLESLPILVRQVLPEPLSEAEIRNIITQSSFIYFEEEGALLFKQGEVPLGFYLILDGIVRSGRTGINVCYSAGWMVGLEAFLTRSPFEHSYFSLTAARTLFVDMRCYTRCFQTNPLLCQFTEKQLSYSEERSNEGKQPE